MGIVQKTISPTSLRSHVDPLGKIEDSMTVESPIMKSDLELENF
jgi:hypothetical protein